jgi:hypothetical protein
VRAAATGEGVPAGTRNRRAENAGRYTRGENRQGSRARQLSLRARLVAIVRAAIVHQMGSVDDWASLPRGDESTKLLRSL